MKHEDLMFRTKAFALEVIRLCAALPNRPEGWVLGKQLLRSGTSIGANYREAQRSRSRPEFLSKIQIVQQEIEETVYWIELLSESGVGNGESLDALAGEVQQLRGIFIAIAKSTAGRPAST
jgi:four helix bundle protein